MSAGFRAVFRGPGLFLAEIAWRWSFGIAAWVLIVLSFREWLASIRFTNADWLAVQSRQPLLIAQAIAHALQGTGARLVKASIIVTVALVVLWIFAASVGRMATLKTLLVRQEKTGFGSLIGLHFLRAALALATIIAFFGTMILTSYAAPVDPTDSSQVMGAVLLFLLLAVLVGFFWSFVNWFLSVAPIFVMRDGCETFGAIAAAVSFFRRRTAPLVGVTLLFDIFRLVILIFAMLFAAMPFTGIEHASQIVTSLWIVLAITLVYFAMADFLYVARLAVYVSIAEQDLAPEARVETEQPPAPAIAPAGSDA